MFISMFYIIKLAPLSEFTLFRHIKWKVWLSPPSQFNILALLHIHKCCYNTNINFHLILSHSFHRYIMVMDWVTKELHTVRFHSFFLAVFASQMGGGPLLHWSIGSRLRWRLFWRLHINSSWSSGTMLLTCNNIDHIWEEFEIVFTPSRSSMRAWMGTAALTTRPRRRWQRISTPVFRLSSLEEQRKVISGKSCPCKI